VGSVSGNDRTGIHIPFFVLVVRYYWYVTRNTASRQTFNTRIGLQRTSVALLLLLLLLLLHGCFIVVLLRFDVVLVLCIVRCWLRSLVVGTIGITRWMVLLHHESCCTKKTPQLIAMMMERYKITAVYNQSCGIPSKPARNQTVSNFMVCRETNVRSTVSTGIQETDK
jgi:hypothetical protein